MVELDERLPGYGFATHKGYNTPEHIAALNRLGAQQRTSPELAQRAAHRRPVGVEVVEPESPGARRVAAARVHAR